MGSDPVTSQCVLCENLCDQNPGTTPAYDCRKESERANIPGCQECTDKLPENAAFTVRCTWECVTGYYLHQVLSEPAQCKPCSLCNAGEYPVAVGCTSAVPFTNCRKCTNIPPNAVPVSNSLPECPWICAPGYYIEYHSKTNAPKKCVALWLLKVDREPETSAITTTTSAMPLTTPPPIVQAVPENFPTRRSTSAAPNPSTRTCETVWHLLVVSAVVFASNHYAGR
jgi:hypothetical protein